MRNVEDFLEPSGRMKDPVRVFLVPSGRTIDPDRIFTIGVVIVDEAAGGDKGASLRTLKSKLGALESASGPVVLDESAPFFASEIIWDPLVEYRFDLSTSDKRLFDPPLDAFEWTVDSDIVVLLFAKTSLLPLERCTEEGDGELLAVFDWTKETGVLVDFFSCGVVPFGFSDCGDGCNIVFFIAEVTWVTARERSGGGGVDGSSSSSVSGGEPLFSMKDTLRCLGFKDPNLLRLDGNCVSGGARAGGGVLMIGRLSCNDAFDGGEGAASGGG
jgi:hypothetical protein